MKQDFDRIKQDDQRRYRRVVVVGSLGFDQIMELPGEFTDWILPENLEQLNVSFTVHTLRREFGGTGGNCAYTLGLLGKSPRLFSRLGRDGDTYLKHLEQSGVDISLIDIDPDHLSALGTVMTDEKQRQIWSYYPGPLTQLMAVSLGHMVKPDEFVALLPSEPKSFVKHLKELVEMEARFMFDPAFFIPNLSIEELELGIQHAQIVIGNEYEISMMERKVNRLISDQLIGNQILIKTVGERGVVVWQGTRTWQIPAVKVKKMIDPSGAGDAFRAGFLAGYIDGKPIEECARMGALAGAYCVENQGTQKHQFSITQFKERLYGKAG
jgi:adenosine kinase